MNHRILVVDDNPLLALEVAIVLKDAGYEVVGPARSVETALEHAQGDAVDAACLDVNLGKETCELVAHRLASINVPFVFLSGLAADHIPAAFADRPRIEKPFRDDLLLDAVARLLR